MDFTAEQLAFQNFTIQFTDQSELSPISDWQWDFNNDSQIDSYEQNPMHQFPGEDTYSVTLTIIVNGFPYSCIHDVIVDGLVVPNPDFIYSIDNPNNKSEVTVDFLDQSEGIISSWEWDFGNGETSISQNPLGISFDELNNYNISLTVSNSVGGDIEEKDFYYNPNETPSATLWEYGLTYFTREFEITSWNLTAPFTFEIDYGDGTPPDPYPNSAQFYHIFEHQYSNTGVYTVVASVTGTGISGLEETAYAVESITIQPFELEIDLSYTVESLDDYYYPSPEHIPPYPYQTVTISTQVSGAGGNPYYTGNWLIRKIGDPEYYDSWNISGSEIDDITHQFPETGTYTVNLVLNNGSSYGQKTLMIDVNTADQYVEAGFNDPQTEVPLGTITYYNALSCLSNPGIPDQYWHPTNMRWTLMKDGQVILPIYNDEFGYTEYQYSRPKDFDFETEGTYILRLETWNNEHGYAQNGLLDIKYANSLAFYDYAELEIIATEDLPFLEVVFPETGKFSLNAEEDWKTIVISNPGNTTLYWQAVVSSTGDGWLEIETQTQGQLCCNENDNIILHIFEYEYYGFRDASIQLYAYSDGYNGSEPVQATFDQIYVYQTGKQGPAFQYFEPDDNYAVDNMKFGEAVAIYEDYAAVGAPGNGGGFRGSTFILSRGEQGIWEITAELVNTFTEPGFGLFGRSVDCHGRYVIVGAHRGMAIYKKPLNGWIGDIDPIFEYEIGEDSFGSSVAIWGDYAVVGSPYEDDEFTDIGKARIFFKDAEGTDQWGLVEEKLGNGSGSYFGTCVDIYNDLVAIGGPHQDNNTGYIDIYNRNHQASNDWGYERMFPDDVYPAIPNAEVGKVFSLDYNQIHYSYHSYSESFQHTWGVHNSTRSPLGYWNHDYSLPINRTLFYEGNPISSISISPNMDFFHGFLPPNDPMGDIVVIPKYTQHEKFLAPAYGYTLPPDWYPYEDWDKPGKSISASLSHTIIGAPGKNSNQGSVLFMRNVPSNSWCYLSWCETEYDLEFVNFEKLPGNYDDVVGRNIKIGGKSYSAVIADGANITYEGVDIVLRDGFIAENGSDFTARSTDCNFANENFSDTELVYNNKGENSGIKQSINLMPMLRSMTYRMPEYPWRIFGTYDDIDEIIILNENNETIIHCENPNLRKLNLDFVHTEFEKLKTLLVLKDRKYIVRLDGLEQLLGQFVAPNYTYPGVSHNTFNRKK